MVKKIIYLAGKVPKSDSEEFVDWRTDCIKILGNKDFDFISPLECRADETDYKSVFGQCCSNIKDSDIVLINANEKLGVGTSQEMIIAKYLGKLVITYLPKGTHHRKENIILTGKKIDDWIHPFIHECSDEIISSYNELKKSISEFSYKKLKNMDIINDSISHYNKYK